MNKTEARLTDFVVADPHDTAIFAADAREDGPAFPPQARRSAIASHQLPVLASAIEFLVVLAATFGAGYAYHDVVFGWFPHAELYLAATASLTALFVGASALSWDYSVNHLNDPRALPGRTFRRWNLAFAFFVFALFMTHATDVYSRASLLAQYGAGLAAALVARQMLATLAAKGRAGGIVGGKRLMLIGDHDMVSSMLHRLRDERIAAEVVGMMTLPRRLTAGTDGGRELADALSRAGAMARERAADDVLVCMPWSSSSAIDALVDGLATVPATVHLAPDLESTWMRDPETARVGSMRTLRLARAPLSLRNRVLKRGFDLAVASALLLVALPALLAIALAIRLDSPGPVLFRQRRCGFNQQPFRVFKFRSMTTMDDGAHVPQARRNDSRVTRVGAFLRSTNLDELPQLLNVLAGQMSLVGPRPHALAHDTEYGEKIRIYANRHKVKPGITGWAQINGFRGATRHLDNMRRRVEHDLYYIEHWSLMFDLRILVMTVASPRSYKNAY